MSDLPVAAVTLARTWTVGGAAHLLGAPATDGFESLDAASAEADLRTRARSGDALVVVGSPPGRDRLLRRAPAWGVATIWIGTEDRPEPGLASVALVAPDAAAALAAVAHDARGLVGNTIALAPAIVDCTDEVCITCSDEGRLGEIISVAGEFLPALVRTADGEEEVDVTIVGAVAPHDLILIHAGSAIAVLDDPDPRGA